MKRELEIGETLDGRFTVTGRISGGGLATVFEALDQSSGKKVAIKVPLASHEADPLYYARFVKEEEIGRSLDFPSVVRFLPSGPKSRPYIVMERLEGRLLSDLLQEGRALPVEQALDIAVRIARALAYLHGHGVVHRDLKPGNIMMCSDGTLKVIDLGLAVSSAHPEAGPPLFSPALGTPDYMPPEQVLGKRSDARSDLYSLGAMLYEMATGTVPFHGDNLLALMYSRVAGDPEAPTRLNPRLSAQVEEIILRALERDPAKRYASAADMIEDLEDPHQVVAADRAAQLRPPSRAVMLWLRSRDFAWAFFAIIGFFALAVVFVLMFGRHR
jgi:serine/threonine-protein kinase